MKTLEQPNAQFREKTDSIRNNFLKSLFILMGIILLVSVLVVFYTISGALKPLKELTATANDLANGKIDTAIPKAGSDELGQLANVLERLRISLKKSMDMLKKR
jgi:nitrate/nitrite-specific signal transduction histidine kinase